MTTKIIHQTSTQNILDSQSLGLYIWGAVLQALQNLHTELKTVPELASACTAVDLELLVTDNYQQS